MLLFIFNYSNVYTQINNNYNEEKIIGIWKFEYWSKTKIIALKENRFSNNTYQFEPNGILFRSSKHSNNNSFTSDASNALYEGKWKIIDNDVLETEITFNDEIVINKFKINYLDKNKMELTLIKVLK